MLFRLQPIRVYVPVTFWRRQLGRRLSATASGQSVSPRPVAVAQAKAAVAPPGAATPARPISNAARARRAEPPARARAAARGSLSAHAMPRPFPARTPPPAQAPTKAPTASFTTRVVCSVPVSVVQLGYSQASVRCPKSRGPFCEFRVPHRTSLIPMRAAAAAPDAPHPAAARFGHSYQSGSNLPRQQKNPTAILARHRADALS